MEKIKTTLVRDTELHTVRRFNGFKATVKLRTFCLLTSLKLVVTYVNVISFACYCYNTSNKIDEI